jgi:hypothetical protein
METDIHGVWQKRAGESWEDVESKYNQERHDYLFAWLGNVRNGFGFAGRPTHEPVASMTDCRGLPDDFENDGYAHKVSDFAFICPRRREWQDEGDFDVWMGDHSFSWIHVYEVLSNEEFCADENVAYFADECRRLKELHGDVRFVFGFDS